MHLTQTTILLLYLCMEGIYRVENKQNLLGSTFLALGISIKILPIVFIPYLLYRGFFKASILTIGLIILILFIPALFIGYDHNWFLLNERWNLIYPFNSEHALDVTERSFHSISTLLTLLLTDSSGNIYSMELKRNIANLNFTTLGIFVNEVRLVLVIASLYFIRSWPFRRNSTNLNTFYGLSYIFLIIPLIFPHQQHNSFFFIFPAVGYLVFYYILKFLDLMGKT